MQHGIMIIQVARSQNNKTKNWAVTSWPWEYLLYVGDDTTPAVGIVTSHYKDPY